MWRSIVLLLVVTAAPAHAYSPKRPVRHDVASPNGAFVLDVDPGAKRFTIYAAGKRDKALWSFERHVGLGKHYISDDGKSVVCVAWKFVRSEDIDDASCVEFWDQTGMIRQYTCGDLCPHPARILPWESGPVGIFSRIWYEESGSNGESVRVRTTDEFEYVFAMNDGSILQQNRIRVAWWIWPLVLALVPASAVTFFVFRRCSRRKVTPSASDPS